MNERHHAVVRILKGAADLLQIPARVEPYNLCEDTNLRPDIQFDLPEVTVLSDVTISHPNALRWRAVAANRGVEAVGDARGAEKDAKYGDMARTLEVEFSPFVLYSFGGFHKSALSVINQLGAASDPAVSLISVAAWKNDVKDRIAVCVQRRTAQILIEDDRRARAAGVEHWLRGTQWRKARALRRSRSAIQPSRRPLLELDLNAPGPRTVSLCAPLLASSYVVPAAMGCPTAAAREPLLSAPPASPVPATPEESYIPGTPGMDDLSMAAAASVNVECVHTVNTVNTVNMAGGLPASLGDVHMAVSEREMGESEREMGDLCVSRAGAGVSMETGGVGAASVGLVAGAV